MLRTECVACLCGSCQSRQWCDWGCDRACGGKDGFPLIDSCSYYEQESIRVPHTAHVWLMELCRLTGYRKGPGEIVSELILQEVRRKKLLSEI